MNRVHCRLELNVDAERVRARTRVRHVIETARRDVATAARVAVRGVDLRIQAGVARQQEEVVTRDIHAGRLAAHYASGERERITDRDVLETCEGAVLDP